MPSTAILFHFFAAPCCPLLPVISPPTWRWFTTISRPTTDLAASKDVAQLLYPEWRNSLEKPFLWLGDFHPYLFTNLLRSFLDDGDDDDDDGDHEVGETCSFCDTPWQILMAWKNPSETLMARIEQIECALRLMVPALVARVRNAQLGLFDRVATDWGLFQGKREGAKAVIGKAVMGQMDEMLGVFLDANRLRKSVLAEIIGETNVYQAALFLEGLAQFFVGFRDHELLSEFERCTVPINWKFYLRVQIFPFSVLAPQCEILGHSFAGSFSCPLLWAFLHVLE